MVKNPPANARDRRDSGSITGPGRPPGVESGDRLQYSCLEKFHGQRRLVGYSPWDHKESDTTEWLTVKWIWIVFTGDKEFKHRIWSLYLFVFIISVAQMSLLPSSPFLRWSVKFGSKIHVLLLKALELSLVPGLSPSPCSSYVISLFFKFLTSRIGQCCCC